MPETADTATILIRFRVATDSIDAEEDGNECAFDFLRFGVCVVVLVGMAFPRWRARPPSGLTLTLPCRDLSPICSHHCMLTDEKA